MSAFRSLPKKKVTVLTSNGIVESLFGEMACLIGRVQDFIVEDGEVKGQTKTDWVCGCKVGLGNFGGILVSLERLVCRLLALVANSELSEVTVVITLPEEFISDYNQDGRI